MKYSTRRTLAAVLAGVSFATAAPAGAYVLTLEADGYTDVSDLGGRPIDTVGCSGASQGIALEGIDLSGEWISWDVVVDQQVTVSGSVRSAGAELFERRYTLTVWSDDESRVVFEETVSTPPGTGIS